MKQGKLVVITGPSGVGKGTLVRSLLRHHPELYLSISATTRQPRTGEINGQDYYFVSRSEFEHKIDNGQLLEWAEYGGNYYGTPRTPVERQIERDKIVILEIEVLGARQVKATFTNALLLFILPPSEQELERRLRGRGNDSEEAILRRLQKAKEEIAVRGEFNYQIINDNLEIALLAIENLIF
jgi:guanylate kinase